MTDADATRLHLTIDGRSVEVEAGTIVAAALVMAGAGGTRTSVSGEPRAALCGMGVCQECRVTIDGRAHALACQTLCRDGQVVCTAAAAANAVNATNATSAATATSGTNAPTTTDKR
ncbi:(2Fe-2S)-binding protein [Paraburkholderia sp. RL16-012-BIC-B]|nr:(2Fe-2S)-binding protein [Paraburkholderia madseniana]